MVAQVFQQVTSNFDGTVRRETLYGRDYLVAPVTMIVPGVLNGSQGALYYPPDELGNDPLAWNNMPIVVYHPTTDGGPASARDPTILDKRQVGTVFNTVFNGRLQAEAWFDVERTKQIDRRIYDSLERREPIELSTGLFTKNTPAQNGAHYQGKPYQYIARNYRPDHLAILPDQVGACSLKDGCGVLINEAEFREVQATYNRDWPQAKRDKLQSKDFAGPNQSFPITTQADVDAAAKLVGKAKNPAAVKARIISIAKRKNLKIPEAWQESTVNFNPNQPRDSQGRFGGGGGGGGGAVGGKGASKAHGAAQTGAGKSKAEQAGYGKASKKAIQLSQDAKTRSKMVRDKYTQVNLDEAGNLKAAGAHKQAAAAHSKAMKAMTPLSKTGANVAYDQHARQKKYHSDRAAIHERMEQAMKSRLTGNYNPNQPRDSKGQFGSGGGGGGGSAKGKGAKGKGGTKIAGVKVTGEQADAIKRLQKEYNYPDSSLTLIGSKTGSEVFATFATPKKMTSVRIGAKGSVKSQLAGGKMLATTTRRFHNIENYDPGIPSSFNRRNPMTKDELVQALIDNGCCYTEEHREDLESLNENTLGVLYENILNQERMEAVINAAEAGFNNQQGDAHTFNVETGQWEYVSNAAGDDDDDEEDDSVKPMTEEEWEAQAPDSVKNTLHFARAIETKERDKLIKVITANSQNKFAETELQAMKTPMLESLAALAYTKTPDTKTGFKDRISFFGATAPVTNTDGEPKATPLIPPTINWTELAKRN